MKKISIIEVTLVVDTPEEVEATKKVLDAKNVDYKTDWTDITIREQMTAEEYAKLVNDIENAL